MKEKTQSTATAFAVAQPQGGTALANIIPINSIEDVSRLGVAVAKSGWFGNIPQSTGEMIAMTMLQDGISPITFMRKYHVIKNVPSPKTRARVSAFKRLGGKMKLHEVSDNKCDITFSYDGNVLRHSVELQKYIDNGIALASDGTTLKDNWAKFPGDMLFARCCSFAIPKVCPEADDGLYTAEEVADFEDESESPAQKPEPTKIDKADVVSRIAKAEPAAAPTPALAKPAPAPQPEVVEAEVVEPVQTPAPAKEPAAPAPAPSAADTCPIQGPFFNVPFSQMEPDILGYLLLADTAANHPELTPAHVESAKAAARAKGMEV